MKPLVFLSIFSAAHAFTTTNESPSGAAHASQTSQRTPAELSATSVPFETILVDYGVNDLHEDVGEDPRAQALVRPTNFSVDYQLAEWYQARASLARAPSPCRTAIACHHHPRALSPVCRPPL